MALVGNIAMSVALRLGLGCLRGGDDVDVAVLLVSKVPESKQGVVVENKMTQHAPVAYVVPSYADLVTSISIDNPDALAQGLNHWRRIIARWQYVHKHSCSTPEFTNLRRWLEDETTPTILINVWNYVSDPKTAANIPNVDHILAAVVDVLASLVSVSRFLLSADKITLGDTVYKSAKDSTSPAIMLVRRCRDVQHAATSAVFSKLVHIHRSISGVKYFIVQATFNLLTEVVQISSANATRMFASFTWSMKCLNKYIHMHNRSGTTTQQAATTDVRFAFVRFILSFLRQGDAQTKQSILSLSYSTEMLKTFDAKDIRMLSEITKALVEDVFKDKSLPRTSKISFFHTSTLIHLLKPYDVNELRDIIHKFWKDISLTPNFGINFKDNAWNLPDAGLQSKYANSRPDVKIFNKLLSKVIVALKPLANPLQKELLIEIFKVTPELVAFYWDNVPFSFEPRASSHWTANMAFLLEVLRLPIPRNSGLYPAEAVETSLDLLEQLASISTPPSIYHVTANCFPSCLSKTGIYAKGLQATAEIRLPTIVALVVGFQKLKEVLELSSAHLLMISSIGSKADEIQNRWIKWRQRLLDGTLRLLPDVQIVIGVLAKETSDGSLAAVYTLLQYFSLYFPEAVLQTRFDFCKLIPKGNFREVIETANASLEQKECLLNCMNALEAAPELRPWGKQPGLVDLLSLYHIASDVLNTNSSSMFISDVKDKSSRILRKVFSSSPAFNSALDYEVILETIPDIPHSSSTHVFQILDSIMVECSRTGNNMLDNFSEKITNKIDSLIKVKTFSVNFVDSLESGETDDLSLKPLGPFLLELADKFVSSLVSKPNDGLISLGLFLWRVAQRRGNCYGAILEVGAVMSYVLSTASLKLPNLDEASPRIVSVLSLIHQLSLYSASISLLLNVDVGDVIKAYGKLPQVFTETLLTPKPVDIATIVENVESGSAIIEIVSAGITANQVASVLDITIPIVHKKASRVCSILLDSVCPSASNAGSFLNFGCYRWLTTSSTFSTGIELPLNITPFCLISNIITYIDEVLTSGTVKHDLKSLNLFTKTIPELFRILLTNEEFNTKQVTHMFGSAIDILLLKMVRCKNQASLVVYVQLFDAISEILFNLNSSLFKFIAERVLKSSLTTTTNLESPIMFNLIVSLVRKTSITTVPDTLKDAILRNILTPNKSYDCSLEDLTSIYLSFLKSDLEEENAVADFAELLVEHLGSSSDISYEFLHVSVVLIKNNVGILSSTPLLKTVSSTVINNSKSVLEDSNSKHYMLFSDALFALIKSLEELLDIGKKSTTTDIIVQNTKFTFVDLAFWLTSSLNEDLRTLAQRAISIILRSLPVKQLKTITYLSKPVDESTSRTFLTTWMDCKKSGIWNEEQSFMESIIISILRTDLAIRITNQCITGKKPEPGCEFSFVESSLSEHYRRIFEALLFIEKHIQKKDEIEDTFCLRKYLSGEVFQTQANLSLNESKVAIRAGMLLVKNMNSCLLTGKSYVDSETVDYLVSAFRKSLFIIQSYIKTRKLGYAFFDPKWTSDQISKAQQDEKCLTIAVDGLTLFVYGLLRIQDDIDAAPVLLKFKALFDNDSRDNATMSSLVHSILKFRIGHRASLELLSALATVLFVDCKAISLKPRTILDMILSHSSFHAIMATQDSIHNSRSILVDVIHTLVISSPSDCCTVDVLYLLGLYYEGSLSAKDRFIYSLFVAFERLGEISTSHVIAQFNNDSWKSMIGNINITFDSLQKLDLQTEYECCCQYNGSRLMNGLENFPIGLPLLDESMVSPRRKATQKYATILRLARERKESTVMNSVIGKRKVQDVLTELNLDLVTEADDDLHFDIERNEDEKSRWSSRLKSLEESYDPRILIHLMYGALSNGFVQSETLSGDNTNGRTGQEISIRPLVELNAVGTAIRALSSLRQDMRTASYRTLDLVVQRTLESSPKVFKERDMILLILDSVRNNVYKRIGISVEDEANGLVSFDDDEHRTKRAKTYENDSDTSSSTESDSSTSSDSSDDDDESTVSDSSSSSDDDDSSSSEEENEEEKMHVETISGITTVLDPELSGVVVQFVAEALWYSLRPQDEAYARISGFLLRRPQLDMHDVPMLYELVFSGAGSAGWPGAVRLAMRSVAAARTARDGRVLARRHAGALAAVLAQTPLAVVRQRLRTSLLRATAASAVAVETDDDVDIDDININDIDDDVMNNINDINDFNDDSMCVCVASTTRNRNEDDATRTALHADVGDVIVADTPTTQTTSMATHAPNGASCAASRRPIRTKPRLGLGIAMTVTSDSFLRRKGVAAAASHERLRRLRMAEIARK